jgi:hypothetical protein
MKNINKGEQLHADAFLKQHFSRLKEWSIGDIRKSSGLKNNGEFTGNGAYIGSSILWICAIDFFGGLLTGSCEPRGTDRRIKTFVQKYLRKYGHYNPDKLSDLRWSLIHFYTVRHYTLDETQATRRYHLKKIKNRDGLLHLGRMIEDLELAVEDYTKDLWSKPELRIRAYRYFRQTNPLMVIDNSELEFLDEDCDS